MDDNQKVFQRTICPAYTIIGLCIYRFQIHIELTKENKVLSLSGKYRHSAGQIQDYLTSSELRLSEGYDQGDLLKIKEIWERWHLNDMRAGTPSQEEFVRSWKLENTYDYDRACKALDEVGLLFDDGYKYGSGWLKEEVPDYVIRYLFTLPSVDGDSWKDINLEPVNEQEFLKILERA